jgi:hypothetical protein
MSAGPTLPPPEPTIDHLKAPKKNEVRCTVHQKIGSAEKLEASNIGHRQSTMLARRAAFEAPALVCAGCRRTFLSRTSYLARPPLLPTQRRLHVTTPVSGFLDYLEMLRSERHTKYVHKEMGKILEDYENALQVFYRTAQEEVLFLLQQP